MIFDIEKFSEYHPEEFKVKFETKVLVDVLSLGFIEEKRLATPCRGTKMSIEQIFRYQENGYKIKYDDTYLEEMYFLALFYNAKLELEQSQNRSLRLQPLRKTIEILEKKMRKYPKYHKILKETQIKNNPFVDPMELYELKNNMSSQAVLSNLYNYDKLKEAEKNNPITYEDLAYAESELDKFYSEYKELNKFNPHDPRSERALKGELNNYRKINKDQLKKYDI